MTVLDRVRDWFPDRPCVVALSGGADSASTLAAAVALGCDVSALTIDHGRPESQRLVEAATSIASKLGVPHRVIAVEPGGTEDVMRTRRYEALENAAPTDAVIVTGHSLDDQVETVIANLARGAGTSGLSGIPRRRNRLVRPMLDVSRAELRKLASDWELPFVDDPTNEELEASRNRIRHMLIPALVEAFDDGVIARIATSAELAAIDDHALEALADRHLLASAGGEVKVARHLLRTASPAVASRVARRALRRVLDPYPGTRRDVVAMLTVAAGAVDRLALSNGFVVTEEGPWVTIHPAEPPLYPLAVQLAVPGVAKFGPWSVRATTIASEPEPRTIGRWVVSVSPFESATVRSVEPGDRIAMGEGTKSVAEALREAGVPARLRSGWPAVDVGGRMAWLVGSRVADWARPQPGSPVVRIEAQREVNQ